MQQIKKGGVIRLFKIKTVGPCPLNDVQWTSDPANFEKFDQTLTFSQLLTSTFFQLLRAYSRNEKFPEGDTRETKKFPEAQPV